jgi:hypothetical protein
MRCSAMAIEAEVTINKPKESKAIIEEIRRGSNFELAKV